MTFDYKLGDITHDIIGRVGFPAKEHRFAKYRHDPVGFCEDVLGFHPWGSADSPTGHGGQQAILEDLWRHHFVKVDSCNNAGKSYLAAHVILAFNQCIPNSLIISTAPTSLQLDNVWRPLRSAWGRSRSKLAGRILTDRIEVGPKWYAQGFSSDSEERYQGPHFEQQIDWGDGDERGPVAPKVTEDYGAILVVIDEHGGIKEFVWNALLGYLAQRNAYVLMIGNPNKAEGVPYEITQTGRWVKPWKVHRIAATDVPPAIMDPAFVPDMLATYGEDHPMFKIRVLGEYVEGTTDQLFPLWLLNKAATLRHPMPTDGKHMGLDVARHGRDSSVAVLLDRGRLAAVESWAIPDLTQQAEKVAALADAWGVKPEHIHVDIGMGAGLVDRLNEAGIQPDLVDFGAKRDGDWPELVPWDMPLKPGVERKTELHWALRQMLLKDMICIPDEPYTLLVRRQLQWLLYDSDDQGRMFVEPKKKLKTRTGGESPDFADALIFALARSGGNWGAF